MLTALGAPVVGALLSIDAPPGIEIAGVPVTGADGRVSIPAIAGHVAGDFVVTVRALGALAPIQVVLHVLPALPARLTADAASLNQTTRVGTTFSQPIVVTLYDQWDNRIPNAPITFVAPVLGAWGQFETTLVPTDSQGRASSRLTAGTTPGSFQAVAVAPLPLVTATIGVRASAGAPHSVQVIPTLLPRKAIVETAYLAPLGVHVQDSFGNPVESAVVRFTPPAAGPSAVLSERSASTDALRSERTALG
ncbi:MAG: hypothetical protein EOO75_16490, partial [Myxococcales bacterium]